jgi:long-chain acyl-CoA synthetase
MGEIDTLGRERKLNSLEKPKKIYMSSDPFSVENDILTPTFKLKRNVAKKVYQSQIDEMYTALEAEGF